MVSTLDGAPTDIFLRRSPHSQQHCIRNDDVIILRHGRRGAQQQQQHIFGWKTGSNGHGWMQLNGSGVSEANRLLKWSETATFNGELMKSHQGWKTEKLMQCCKRKEDKICPVGKSWKKCKRSLPFISAGFLPISRLLLYWKGAFPLSLFNSNLMFACPD